MFCAFRNLKLYNSFQSKVSDFKKYYLKENVYVKCK